MELKVDKGKFSQTQSKQQAAMENLQTYHSEQQTALAELAATWKGTGGDAFRDCAEEISNETIMGILLISTLDNQAQNAKDYLDAADRDIAKSISGQGA